MEGEMGQDVSEKEKVEENPKENQAGDASAGSADEQTGEITSEATEARPAKLKADMFWTGKAAHDSSDRIIYDKATGALYYDADGTGRSAQVKIATLTKNQKVTVSDFFVI